MLQNLSFVAGVIGTLRVKLWLSNVHIEGSQALISKFCISYSEGCFCLWQIVKTLMKFHTMQHFIWVLTVCQIHVMHLGVTSSQMIKVRLP